MLRYEWQEADGPCVLGSAWPRYALPFVRRALTDPGGRLLEANAALVVHVRFERSPIAMLRYFRQGGMLGASGTWVRAKYRRLGLGCELWRRVLERENPREIWCAPITRKSTAMIAKVQGSFPQCTWFVWQGEICRTESGR